MIRLILVLLFLVLYFLIGLIFQLVIFIIKKFNKTKADKLALKIVQCGFRIILFLSGVKITVKGRENIPTDTAVLYVGNHRSYFDIVIGYTLVPNLTGFVAKKEMTHIPFLSQWMRSVNCLFLDRDNIKEGLKTILQGIEYIKSGISIWIFPEGTRNKNFNCAELNTFKEGSLKMAEKAKVPIVPVAIRGTDDIFEKHFPSIKKGNVTIEFGKPIYIDQLAKEEKKFLGAYTQHTISAMLA